MTADRDPATSRFLAGIRGHPAALGSPWPRATVAHVPIVLGQWRPLHKETPNLAAQPRHNADLRSPRSGATSHTLLLRDRRRQSIAVPRACRDLVGADRGCAAGA